MFTKLKKKLKKLNCVDSINRGGCGISALAIYKYLERKGKLVEDTAIVYLYADDDDYIFYKNQNNRNLGFTVGPPAHAILRLGEYYIDSTNVSKNIKDFKHAYNSHEMSLDELINSVNTGGWSFMFDREIEIPKIEKIMKVELSEVEILD